MNNKRKDRIYINWFSNVTVKIPMFGRFIEGCKKNKVENMNFNKLQSPYMARVYYVGPFGLWLVMDKIHGVYVYDCGSSRAVINKLINNGIAVSFRSGIVGSVGRPKYPKLVEYGDTLL